MPSFLRSLKHLGRCFTLLIIVGMCSVFFSLIHVDVYSGSLPLQTRSMIVTTVRDFNGNSSLEPTTLGSLTNITTALLTDKTPDPLTNTTSAPSMNKNTAPDIFDDIEALANSFFNLSRDDLVLNLTQLPWEYNIGNIKSYRYGLQSEIKMNTGDHLILTQTNTPLNSKIPTLDGPNVKASKSIIRELPKDSSLPEKPYKCSIVGSSGILSGSQCGPEIDSADVVFRFNLAPTTGFEEDVGSKTTMTTMNPSIFRVKFNNLKTKQLTAQFADYLKEHHALIWTPAFAYSGNYKLTEGAIRKVRPLNKELRFVMQDTRHFFAMNTFWKNYSIRSMLSTGFYFVTSALDLCKQVDVYGFWPFNATTDGRTLSYHYFDDIPFNSHHSMSTEFVLLAAMHDFGLLKLHVGNCSAENN